MRGSSVDHYEGSHISYASLDYARAGNMSGLGGGWVTGQNGFVLKQVKWVEWPGLFCSFKILLINNSCVNNDFYIMIRLRLNSTQIYLHAER